MKINPGKRTREKMENYVDEFFCNIIKYAKNRKVIIWGRNTFTKSLKEKLELKKIEIAFFIDSNMNKVDDNQTKSISILDGNQPDYYVIIPLAVHNEIKQKLEKYGYQEKEDYYYFCDCIVKNEENYYKDAHGNEIIGHHKKCKVKFMGYNSQIIIKDNVEFNGIVKIDMYSNANVTIYENVIFGDNAIIYCDNNAIIEIGKSVEFKGKSAIAAESITQIYLEENITFASGLDIRSGKDAFLKIGRNGTFGDNFVIHLEQESRIVIGNDCMFSIDICMRSHDGHSLFDINEAKKINQKSKSYINIGNHVWVGQRAMIMNPTVIEDGSVVGAYGLVKGQFPNNCCIGGGYLLGY